MATSTPVVKKLMPCYSVPNPYVVTGIAFMSMLFTSVLLPRALPEAKELQGSSVEGRLITMLFHIIVMWGALSLMYPSAPLEPTNTVPGRSNIKLCPRDTMDERTAGRGLSPVWMVITYFIVAKFLTFMVAVTLRDTRSETRQLTSIMLIVVELVAMFIVVGGMEEKASKNYDDRVAAAKVAPSTFSSLLSPSRTTFNSKLGLDALLRSV